MGPSINDVTLIFHISGPPPPFVTHSRNLSVLFVRKIGQFLNPPSPLERDVIYEWSLVRQRGRPAPHRPLQLLEAPLLHVREAGVEGTMMAIFT